MLSEAIELPEKLPGSFWGLTTFFNPNNYKNKISNYGLFRESAKRQGLKLVTVECAFKNSPFQLTAEDADILIQVRSNSVLWQKESLLNIALSKLPSDCDKISWIDNDIIFLNDNWVSETSKLLEKYVIVKPFKQIIRSSEKDSLKILKTGVIERVGIRQKMDNCNLHNKNVNNFVNYISVFAWAARRSVFNDIGFYSKMIIGGGDSIITSAFIGQKPIINNLPIRLEEDINIWSDKIYKKVKNSIVLSDGIVLHLFHGSLKNRKYDTRYSILKKHNFDPSCDVSFNKDNCLEWASPKKELHRYLYKYFYRRNEKNSCIRNIILFIRYKEDRNIYIDMIIGIFGNFIKNFFPSYYLFLKRILKLK